jgi:hypothetical protein
MDVVDRLEVHAKAAALAVDASFTDVATGFPVPRGRSARLFYGGERDPERLGAQTTLNSRLIAEAVELEGYWPIAEYGAKKGRALMREMQLFVHELRTRTLADSQLDNESSDLSMHLAEPGRVEFGGATFAVIGVEWVIDYSEYEVAA